MTWEDVIFSLPSLAVDKGKQVKDLCIVINTPSNFFECSARMKAMVCTECGVEGWEEAFVAAIMDQATKVHMHIHDS